MASITLQAFQCEPPRMPMLLMIGVSPKLEHNPQLEFQIYSIMFPSLPNLIIIGHILPCQFMNPFMLWCLQQINIRWYKVGVLMRW
jgi:hypothetical protein